MDDQLHRVVEIRVTDDMDDTARAVAKALRRCYGAQKIYEVDPGIDTHDYFYDGKMLYDCISQGSCIWKDRDFAKTQGYFFERYPGQFERQNSAVGGLLVLRTRCAPEKLAAHIAAHGIVCGSFHKDWPHPQS